MNKQVVLFSTCLIEHLYPNVGMDALAVLRYCGINVTLPSFQSCCGQPAYNSGAKKQATDVARKTIDTLLAEDGSIIVPSASCADMLINHYPRLFRNDAEYASKAVDLASRTYELISFIEPLLPETLNTSDTLFLHVSCSARRGLKCTKQWDEVAKRLSKNINEPEYAEECCGFGGTFSVKAPEISSAMAKDKCSLFIEAGAQEFISGDCGCLMHLSSYAEKQSLALTGKHLITQLAEQLGIAYEQ